MIERFTITAQTAEQTREVLSGGNYVTEGGKEHSLSDVYVLDILAARQAEIFYSDDFKDRVFQLVIPFNKGQAGKIVRGSLGGIVKDDQPLNTFFDQMNRSFPQLFCESEIEDHRPFNRTHESLLQRSGFAQVKNPAAMVKVMQEFLGPLFADEGMPPEAIDPDTGAYTRQHGTGITLHKKLYTRNTLITKN